jgi:exonuclease III
MTNKTTAIHDFILDHNIDVLCITETWLTGNENDNPVISAVLPPGYSMQHVDRIGAKGGGCAIIHQSGIQTKPSTEAHEFSTFECCDYTFMAAHPIRIIVVYRPPNNSHLPMSQFFDEFASLLEAVSIQEGHTLLLGDINFHVNDHADRNARKLLEMLDSMNMKQHVTKCSHRSGNILDLVITRDSDALVQSAAPEDHGFPDHYPVFVKTSPVKPPRPTKTITYRKVKAIEKEKLIAAIAASAIVEIQPDTPLEVAIELYDNELKKILDDLAPLKTRTVTIRHDSEWYNDSIRQAKQERRRAERKWRKTQLVVDREIFIDHREKVNGMIDSAKHEFYQNMIANCTDSKSLFAVVDRLLGRRQSAPLPSQGSSSEELAEMFSEYFVEKIRIIRTSIPIVVADPTTRSQNILTTFDSFEPVSPCEMMKLIMNSPNKSCALDPIPTNLVKTGAVQLNPILTHIVNASLSQGIFPDEFKTALVKPLLKKPSLNCEELKNYRPVSNLSLASKLVERAASKQLNAYLTENGLQEPHQSAYRQGHSTETALMHVYDSLVRSIGDRKAVLFVMLDLSAAFDTVDHHLLHHSLQDLGITGTAADWFKSYLMSRIQNVTVKNAVSEPQELDCGVPQGSVLGPILFTLYTASLGSLLRKHGVCYHFYADDAQIWLPFEPSALDDAKAVLEKCLDDVRKWMAFHKLKLNADKSEYIVIRSKQIAQTFQTSSLSMDGASLMPSTATKNLGTVMQSDASMDAQVKAVCSACYLLLRNINKIKKFMDRSTLDKLIHAFISCKLDYCNGLLVGATQSQIKRLQKVQNAAARMLTGASWREHMTPVLRELHWLPVEQRIKYKVLLIVHKVLRGDGPAYLSSFIKPREDQGLRAHHHLQVPFTRAASVFDRAFSVAAPRMWNDLPIALRDPTKQTETFKKQLKTHLFQTFYPVMPMGF